jgi:hypothetical protein
MVVEDRVVGTPTRADFEEFNRAWVLFVRKDPGWKAARTSWLDRGGFAPYVLAENLLRYFWSASANKGREEILRLAESARACGEPAVGYFANALVLDTWPLREPVVATLPDGTQREFRVWVNDDVSRQHLALVLARIGPPAVPRLSSPGVLFAPSASARRYAAYALGTIATDEAVGAVAGLLSSSDWQDRASAAKALGFALPKNAKARDPLKRAAADSDPFVRRKAEEALAGKSKAEF